MLYKSPPHPFEQKCSSDSFAVSTTPTSRSAPNLPTRPASPPAAAPRWIPYTLGRMTFDLNDLTRVSWPRAPHVPRPTAPLPLRVCNCNVCKDHVTMFTSVVLTAAAWRRWKSDIRGDARLRRPVGHRNDGKTRFLATTLKVGKISSYE